MVVPVRDIDVPFRVDGDTGGTMNDADTGRGPGKGGQMMAVGGEFLHPAVFPVGHIHVDL